MIKTTQKSGAIFYSLKQNYAPFLFCLFCKYNNGILQLTMYAYRTFLLRTDVHVLSLVPIKYSTSYIKFLWYLKTTFKLYPENFKRLIKS